MSAEICFVLSQSTRLKDRQADRRTDRQTYAQMKAAPAYLQRGKKRTAYTSTISDVILRSGHVTPSWSSAVYGPQLTNASSMHVVRTVVVDIVTSCKYLLSFCVYSLIPSPIVHSTYINTRNGCSLVMFTTTIRSYVGIRVML